MKQDAGNQIAFLELHLQQPQDYSWLSCVNQLSTKTHDSFMRPYLP